MKSQYLNKPELEHILASLMPENRLALEVSLATGLRIGDVLALKTQKILKQRFTIKEEKTGKTRNVYLPAELWERCKAIAGRHYVFEHRYTANDHRTRQAVFKDLQRSAKLFRVSEHISPHSTRKVYAVEEYHKT